VAEALNSRGISAASYHADLPHAHRSHSHQQWNQGGIQVIVATVAFGKPQTLI
jgi:ATP-dependent DNA helicase RecQ